MPVREMTYLFVIITVAVINGLALNITYAELIVANLLLIALIAVLEYLHKGNRTSVKLVCYDRIENIVPERREDLIADLKKRLGVEITDVEIGHVDFLKDSAFIKVTYVLPVGDKVPTIESITRAKDFNE